MVLEDFIVNFADQFDDTDISEIKADTAFHKLDEWSSLNCYGSYCYGSHPIWQNNLW